MRTGAVTYLATMPSLFRRLFASGAGAIALTSVVGLAVALGAPAATCALAFLFATSGIVAILTSWRTAAETAHLTQQLADALPADRIFGGATDLGGNVGAACDLLIGMRHRMPRRHSVTGLATREVLLERMARSTVPGFLAVIELKDFDELCAQNIAVADIVLKNFAARALRMTGELRMIAQIDRARFAILFPEDDVDAAQREFEALCYALRGRIEAPGIDMLPQIAVATLVIDPEIDSAAMLAQAIAGLTQLGSGVAATLFVEDTGISRDRFLLEQDLRQAVARSQFELHYQPFIDAERGQVCGAEALIRWQHPERGMISPGVFVPLVEKAGLAEEVGMWVLDTAICEAAAWQRSGITGVKVAANLSAHQLARPELDAVIKRMIARHGLGEGLLELELTETVAAIDPGAASALFERLRQSRITISIDDFGAGYSSLSYLKKMSFDKLKIDREFVTLVDQDRQSQAICQSIIALGRGLGISVLAEGVERPEEYAWLRRHGCRYFQGYYFAKPLKSADFTNFTQDRAYLAERTELGPVALQKKLGVAVA